MKILNEKRLDLGYSADYITPYEVGAHIVKLPEELESTKIGVYVPRFMYGIDFSEGAKDDKTIEISTDKLANSQDTDIGETTVTEMNYITVTPMLLPGKGIPQYKKGEKVFVRFIDQDIENPIMSPISMNEAQKREVDAAIDYVSASGEVEEPLDEFNTYFIKKDSKSKKIQIHMSDKNDEVSIYDLIMDGENGYVTLKDEKRSLNIITDDDIMSMENEEGTVIAIREDTAIIKATNIEFEGEKNIKFKTKNYEIETENYKLDCDDYVEESDTREISGNKFNTNYEIVEEDGDMKTAKYGTKIVFDSDINSFTGNVGFESSFSMGTIKELDKLPIDPTGDSTMFSMGPTAKNLAIAEEVIKLLTTMCATYDAMEFAGPGKLIKAPMSPSVLPQVSNVISKTVKG